MSKFKIGDIVEFAAPPNDGVGVVMGFDEDGDAYVEWSDYIGHWYDHQLCYAGWSDFEERIKERLF